METFIQDGAKDTKRYEEEMDRALDRLEKRMLEIVDTEIHCQRPGFNAGMAVFAWFSFWELAAIHQDDWRFILLTWICVGTAIWAATHL